MLACWVYRQPLAFFWTIPEIVLVGPALGHSGMNAAHWADRLPDLGDE